MGEAAGPSKSGAKSGPKTETESGLGERGSTWLFVVLSLAAASLVLVGLWLGVGVQLDAPTFALATACVVMIWALRSMWGVVVALSRPPAEVVMVEAELLGLTAAEHSTSELREEKRRVLRAIKELEFDHAMGKLSDEDFREVGDRYRLRAIEVMRQLGNEGQLHPQLVAHLQTLGLDPHELMSPKAKSE